MKTRMTALVTGALSAALLLAGCANVQRPATVPEYYESAPPPYENTMPNDSAERPSDAYEKWAEGDGETANWVCFDTLNNAVYRFQTPVKAEGPLADRVRALAVKIKAQDMVVIDIEVDSTEATANPGTPYSMAWSTTEATSRTAMSAESWADSQIMTLNTGDSNWETVVQLSKDLRAQEARMGTRVHKLYITQGPVNSMIAPAVGSNLCSVERA